MLFTPSGNAEIEGEGPYLAAQNTSTNENTGSFVCAEWFQIRTIQQLSVAWQERLPGVIMLA
jgi:hypothetical protein